MQYDDNNKIGYLEFKEMEMKLDTKLKENKIDLDKYDLDKVIKMVKEKGIFK